ncbi:MAG: hypothetical protein ACFFD4_34120 [Candidatus Odinarchaeota archaeon]
MQTHNDGWELILSDTFTSWLNAVLSPLVDAYGQMLANFPFNFLSYIISALLLALFLQVVFTIFPPLKSLVDTIMAPFRIVHIWLHLQAARAVIEKRKKSNELDNYSLGFTALFSTGFGTKVERPAIALSGTCSPREAASIANAPLKGALVLLLFLTLLTPFLRTSFAGKLVHLYFFIGIATSSFPSASDYKYTYNMLLLNSQLPFTWLLLPVAVFSATFILVMTWLGNLVYAIIWGIAAISFSTWILLMVAMRSREAGELTAVDNREVNFSTRETVANSVYSDTSDLNAINYLYQLENEH